MPGQLLCIHGDLIQSSQQPHEAGAVTPILKKEMRTGEASPESQSSRAAESAHPNPRAVPLQDTRPRPQALVLKVNSVCNTCVESIGMENTYM